MNLTEEKALGAVEALTISSEATACRLAEGVLEVVTPAQNWSWAVIGRFSPVACDETVIGFRCAIDLELVDGKIGIFLSNDAPRSILGEEKVVSSPGRQCVMLDHRGPAAAAFCARSYDGGSAKFRIHRIALYPLRRVDITPIIERALPDMLQSPGPHALATIAELLATEPGGPWRPEEFGVLELDPARLPIPLPPPESLFCDEAGQVIVRETRQLIDLLRSYDPSRLAAHIGHFDIDYYQKYLTQNTIRVWHLVRLLGDLGLTRGSVLEVGAFMGSFAIPLQRLGYQVTVVDRYENYEPALDHYVDYMRSAGINVVRTTRGNEAAIIGSLDRYDAVISMAVIEHIPHTPRLFLEMLAARVREGGVLAIDTPNIARYWNRRLLSRGISIHQDIKAQFDCDPPYEGHHREYTADELVWMMCRIGCKAIQTRLFDYNLLQFDRLEKPHDEALLQITVDPAQADTILAAGRI